MSVTILNNKSHKVIGASLYVPAPARDLYEVVFDVRNFPSWASGVRRVEVVEGPVGPGMVSEWEISVLGLKTKISSVLEEAEDPTFLRWSYDGIVHGWGQCLITDRGDGALAEFTTELCPRESAVERLLRMPVMKSAVTYHLKRCLTRLGQVVCRDGGRVRVRALQ